MPLFRTPRAALPLDIRIQLGLLTFVVAVITLIVAGCHHNGQGGMGWSPPRIPGISHPLFQDVAAQAGLNFRLGHASLQNKSILDTIGHGCGFIDYDRDGRLDILLVSDAGPRLYHNEGGGHFTDVTAKALPPPPPHAHFMGCAVADYDGDGWPDIFLTGYGSTALYHNQRNGTFKDVTRGSGLEARGPYDWTTSAAWVDLQGRSLPDLYVCRYLEFTPETRQLWPYVPLVGTQKILMSCSPTTYAAEKGSLYRNLGGGRFEDITLQSGLDNAQGHGLGCMFCDFNHSGRPSLFVANDLTPCDLFLNQGNGHFRNIGVASGVAFGADGSMQSGMGVDWGDYDNDGLFDLLVANFTAQPKSLYHNEGHNTFTNVSYSSGIGAASLTRLAFGAKFTDAQNRGLLDIVFVNGHVNTQVELTDRTTSYFQPTQYFRNLGSGKFEDDSAQAGPDFLRPIVGRGIAEGDYDGDGREDLLVVNDEGPALLLHNVSRTSNHWITLHCLWSPKLWYAVGAEITLKTREGNRIGEVRAAGSYLSADSPEVHFGLGSDASPVEIDVRWPDGKKSVYRDVKPDAAYRITPTGLPVAWTGWTGKT